MSAADVCAAAVAAVEVTGAWLSAARGAEAGHLMRVTDEVSEQLAGLHLTLGECPCLDAAASGGPVLASDLAGGEPGRRWPVFALPARQAGAAAVFAFPLRTGAIRAGVLGLYRERPGPLTAFQLGDALIFADTATLPLPGTRRGATSRHWPAPVASPRTWHFAGPRSTRPAGCSPGSPAPASGMHSCGCAPMLMHVICG